MSKKEEVLAELEQTFKHRKVAQIVLQAVTPLKVASGESDTSIDAPVLKNWNNLPMIQGSSIVGVLRASIEEKLQNHLFGKDNGSRVLVSHLHLLDENMEIPYGLGRPPSPLFLDKYDDLPVREHTAIEHTGVAKSGHKFDEEIVYAGSRFKFEIEFLSTNTPEDNTYWDMLLSELTSPLFRLGGGSTKGFGEMEVKYCHVHEYEVGKDYHNKPTNLNTTKGTDTITTSTQEAVVYKINLEPDDFFSFGFGFGDDDVDDIAVTEEIVKWDNNKGSFSSKQILFPASSLKGALSHRVAFHYNALEGNFIDSDKVTNIDDHIGENNQAVSTIFGAAKGHKNEAKGKALFLDMFKTFDENEVKIFDHVKIDRFTGGAMDSALYDEKVIAHKDTWKIKIILANGLEDNVKKAFELTLDDLAKGWLPLGGKVNRGHGVFVSPEYDVDDASKRGWSCTKGGKNV